MKISTLESIAGRSVSETLGYIRGTAIWSRRIMKNRTVGLRALEHMTNDDIANGLAKVREDAEIALQRNAVAMGADAVIGLRIELIELGNDTFQAVAFGTAVRTDALPLALPAFEEPVFEQVFDRPANEHGATIIAFRPRQILHQRARRGLRPPKAQLSLYPSGWVEAFSETPFRASAFCRRWRRSEAARPLPGGR